MIYIPSSGVPVHPDEQKYSKLFLVVLEKLFNA